MVVPDLQSDRSRGGLTSVYTIEADDAHASLFLQVLQLTLPVAAHSTVDLPQWRENDNDETDVLQSNLHGQ